MIFLRQVDSVVWSSLHNGEMRDRNGLKRFTIGQVAEYSDVGVETVRFYERAGWISKADRTASGLLAVRRRDDCPATVHRGGQRIWVHAERRKEPSALRIEPATRCPDVKDRAEAKIADIDEKIGTRKRISTPLKKVTSECTGKGPVSECSILDALDSRD